MPLYAFTQDEARVLHEFAREQLLRAKADTPMRSSLVGIRPNRGGVLTTGTNYKKSYLVQTVDENDSISSIPAATEAGGVLTLGEGYGRVLRKDFFTEDLVYDPFGSSTYRVIPIWNQMKKEVNGTKVMPLRVAQDESGTAWVTGGGGGSASIAMAETQDGGIPAATISGTTITPGQGIVYPMHLAGGVMARVLDAGNPSGFEEVIAYNSTLRPVDGTLSSQGGVDRTNGHMIQIQQDPAGVTWITPAYESPSGFAEVNTPISAATITGGKLEPASGFGFLMGRDESTDEMARMQDSNGVDITVKIWNQTFHEVAAADEAPLPIHRDDAGDWWVAELGARLVFFDTYSGTLPAAVNALPGKANCRTYDYDGVNFTLTGGTLEIVNLGAEIPSGGTSGAQKVYMAVVEAGNTPFYDGGRSVCDANNDMTIIAGGSIDDIEYLIGIDVNGDCYRVPVASCPTQVQHG